jgi:hypothetical protein
MNGMVGLSRTIAQLLNYTTTQTGCHFLQIISKLILN